MVTLLAAPVVAAAPPTFDYRAYQTEARDAVVSAWSDGQQAPCLTGPTGIGKTAIGMSVLAEAGDGVRAAWITDRPSTLIESTRETARAFGLRTGIVRADEGTDAERRAADVLICSAQTLDSRGVDPADLDVGLFVVDECHCDRAVVRRWLATGIPALGLTATPLPAFMRDVWTGLITSLTTRQAITAGWILDPLFRADLPDPTELDSQHKPPPASGDWSDAEATDIAWPYLAATVDAWQRLVAAPPAAGGFAGNVPPTIVQACSVEHAMQLVEMFRTARPDLRWGIVSYKHPDSPVQMYRFKHGLIDGLVSIAALSVGFDAPRAACLVSTRPTNRIVTWAQLVGRIMRVPRGESPRTARAVVLDCAGNARRHAARLHRFWNRGATWDLPPQVARDGIGPPPPGERESPVCPLCPDVVQSLTAQVCAQCGRPIEPPEAEPLGMWRDGVRMPDIAITTLLMARDRAIRDPGDPDRAEQWARAQIQVLTGRWPLRRWPPAGWQKRIGDLKTHPVVAGTIRRNGRAYREWIEQPEDDRPDRPEQDDLVRPLDPERTSV